ncbi:MAG: hypothetical protein M3Y36_01105 [Actinomycetota bacterium]|nr:hypothetical protein [Actinomycetota bacterium]
MVAVRWRVGLVAASLIVGLVIAAVVTSAAQAPPPALPTPAAKAVVATVPSTTTPVASPALRLDLFDRPDSADGLGSLPGGPPWQALAGTWGIANQQAYLSAPIADQGLAVVAFGRPLASAQVRVAAMVAGAGLVFAYQDPGNYWVVQAEPSYGTWNVVQVVAGTSRGLGNIGLVPIADGTVVSAAVTGDQVAVAVDGQVGRTFTASTPVMGQGAGLTVSGPGARMVRFEDFGITPAGA